MCKISSLKKSIIETYYLVLCKHAFIPLRGLVLTQLSVYRKPSVRYLASSSTGQESFIFNLHSLGTRHNSAGQDFCCDASLYHVSHSHYPLYCPVFTVNNT